MNRYAMTRMTDICWSSAKMLCSEKVKRSMDAFDFLVLFSRIVDRSIRSIRQKMRGGNKVIASGRISV